MLPIGTVTIETSDPSGMTCLKATICFAPIYREHIFDFALTIRPHRGHQIFK